MFTACCEENIIRGDDYYLYKRPTNSQQSRVAVRSSRINSLVEQTEEPFRLYARAKQEGTVKKIREQQSQFVDAEFPPCPSSLGRYEGREVEWVRLSTLYRQLEPGNYTAMDILMLRDRDSFFLAAITALTEN